MSESEEKRGAAAAAYDRGYADGLEEKRAVDTLRRAGCFVCRARESAAEKERDELGRMLMAEEAKNASLHFQIDGAKHARKRCMHDSVEALRGDLAMALKWLEVCCGNKLPDFETIENEVIPTIRERLARIEDMVLRDIGIMPRRKP